MDRRSAADSNVKWNSVPHPVMSLIFAEVEAICGRQTLASLRLVSKYWRVAVTAYLVSPQKTVKIEDRQGVRDICSLLPDMERLSLSSREKVIFLGPLKALTALTSLKIKGNSNAEAGAETLANLMSLPSRLRELQLDFLKVPSDCLKHMICTGLTSLRCRFGENTHPQIWRLLGRLPKLEVLFRCLPSAMRIHCKCGSASLISVRVGSNRIQVLDSPSTWLRS